MKQFNKKIIKTSILALTLILLLSTTAYAKPLGVGTLVGMAAYALAAVTPEIWRRGTNVPEQLRSGTILADIISVLSRVRS